MPDVKTITFSADQSGRVDAFDDYAEIRVKLERAVANVCPAWLADRREDIVQGALVRLMDVRRRSGQHREFSSTYLWRTASSALIDEIRRWRRQELPLEDGDCGAAASPGPEQQVNGREIGRAIQDCLALLVRPRRLAVVLQLQGHTVPQVARLLGWSPKRAENMVYRGLADLRRRLAERGVRP